ncbi:MAG: MBL fold metallo-hydrolase [Candidatus Hodarchaeales archaeon]|jgi:glyoxylase-like metal-dependent hydrolase (beta-lactamase superfamily II)
MRQILHNLFHVFGQGMNCNGYVINSGENSLLIDSGLGAFRFSWGRSPDNPLKELENVIKSYKVHKIILTHSHLDHTGGVLSLSTDVRNKVHISAFHLDANHLERPDYDYIDPIFKNKEISPLKIDKHLRDGDKITIGEYLFKVIHTPGHSEGSICLYEPEEKWLISGDTVFPMGSMGRVDFPGSNSNAMLESLDKIRKLDVKVLLPGHMEPINQDVSKNLEASYRNAQLML